MLVEGTTDTEMNNKFNTYLSVYFPKLFVQNSPNCFNYLLLKKCDDSSTLAVQYTIINVQRVHRALSTTQYTQA